MAQRFMMSFRYCIWLSFRYFWSTGWPSSPGGSDDKEFGLQCGRPGFDSWVGKIPWRRKWQATPGFLPGKIPWAEEPGSLQPMEFPKEI